MTFDPPRSTGLAPAKALSQHQADEYPLASNVLEDALVLALVYTVESA